MTWKDIQCDICGNKGFIIENDVLRNCVCMKKRNAMRRLENSGLLKGIERCTFDSFDAKEPWQQQMKAKAVKYAEEGAKAGYWLYLGGQAGSGKTHLATAVVGKLAENADIRYCIWNIEVQHLKSVLNDAEKYDKQISELQTVDVLFIDDLFKPGRDRNGDTQAATGADIRVAFDILNYRYINDLPTIISSEWYIRELDSMDEATASRIYEKCGEYKISVKRDVNRNYRYRDDEIV